MEAKKGLTISIDLKNNSMIPLPQYIQNDTNILDILVKENGADADLSNITRIVVNYKRPDKKVISRLLTVIGNVVSYEIGLEEMEVPGQGEMELQFFENEDRISTKRLKVNMLASIGTDAIYENTEQMTVLQELFVEVDTVKAETETARLNADTATEAANTAAANAQLVADENKTRFLPAVAAIADRDTTYPTPAHGDTVRVTGESKTYRYDSASGWVVTDQYNPTAIDQLNADLAEIPQQITTAITPKSDKTYVDTELSKKANTTDLSTKADKSYVDTQIQSVASGSPKGTYATLTDLQTAFPTGNNNIYVVSADGKWYFWNSTAWTAGGTYQSTGIADNTILSKQVSDRAREQFSTALFKQDVASANRTPIYNQLLRKTFPSFFEVKSDLDYDKIIIKTLKFSGGTVTFEMSYIKGSTQTDFGITAGYTTVIANEIVKVYISNSTTYIRGTILLSYDIFLDLYNGVYAIENQTTSSIYVINSSLISTLYAPPPLKSVTLPILDDYVSLRGNVLFDQNVLSANRTTTFNNFNRSTINAYFKVKIPIEFDYLMFKKFKSLKNGSVDTVISYVKGSTITDFATITASTGTIESNKLARITISSSEIEGFLLMDWTLFLDFYNQLWSIENEVIGSIYKINPNAINLMKAGAKAELPIPTYPEMHKKMPNFTKHYYAKDKDVVVVMHGDSISISASYTTEKADAANRPPLTNYNNFAGSLWDKIKWDGQVYNRFDVAGVFTETGTFTTKSTTTSNGSLETEWDENGTTSGYRPTINRYTESATASIAYKIPANYRRSGFIYRSEANGSQCSLSVAEGSGFVEVWNGSAWVEANGYSFSTVESKPTVNHSKSVYQKRLKFRCTEANVGVDKNITISKGTGTRLTYWGVEHGLDDNMFYFINAARGTHNHAALWEHVQNEVFDLKPDLVLFQIPVMNDISPSYGETHPLNYGTDLVNTYHFDLTNPMSYASKSNSFADFDVLYYLPFFAASGNSVDESGNWKYFKNDYGVYSVRDYYNAYIKYFLDNPDRTLINTWDRFIAEAKARGTLYSMVQATSATGDSFTIDGTHLNDLGSSIMAKYMLPCFDFIVV